MFIRIYTENIHPHTLSYHLVFTVRTQPNRWAPRVGGKVRGERERIKCGEEEERGAVQTITHTRTLVRTNAHTQTHASHGND